MLVPLRRLILVEEERVLLFGLFRFPLMRTVLLRSFVVRENEPFLCCADVVVVVIVVICVVSSDVSESSLEIIFV